jgi:uncharacterized membrane protein
MERVSVSGPRAAAWLWGTVLAYAAGRICLLYAYRLPMIWIVVLHVVPPALFALVHGSIVYGRRGIAVFTASCLGFGTLAELVSLRTGVPFGRYHFTNVMGPKVLELPLLLALAYLGIGYVSWILSLLILGHAERPLRGTQVVTVPLLASGIMTAWDLAMDPSWSTLDHAWIWHDGGAYFGVPASNFVGWFLTGTVYYFAFALYCRTQATPMPSPGRNFWSLPVLVYLICALGNLLILALPMAAPIVTDASGRRWMASDILGALTMASLFIMTPLAGLALMRARALDVNGMEVSSLRIP